MKKQKLYILFLITFLWHFLLHHFHASAQQIPLNTNLKWVRLSTGNTFQLDSLSVIPSSIKVLNPDIDSAFILKYDLNTGKILIHSNKENIANHDSILIAYQAFPFALNHKYFKRNIKLYDSTAYYKDPNRIEYQRNYIAGIEKRDELFATQGISKTGNITRGLSFGNTQNVFVNSSLNLQLEGMITPDLKLTAAISDQNIPIQPEGNTQQIQQFDRVYVQLDHKKGRLTAGDLVLKNGETYFLNYLKNVQGGLLETNYNISNKSSANTAIGASVAKGKFSSLTLDVKEGVQGPYRLKGPNNERFVIVIANSEKVFLDGKQLIRGFNYDYIIDYNTGEITFTANVVITRFSRVRVDYEYSDRNYSRTNIVASHQQNYGKLNFAFDYYSEEDNPNNPLTLTLSQQDKEILNRVGDTLYSASSSGVDSVEFNSNQVLYTDSIFGGQKIYIYSTDENKARFRIVFSEVGFHAGDYISITATANGKVYEYVAPIGGIKQGSYAPVRILPTPKKKNMAAIAMDFQYSKVGKVYFEGAISKNDLNLFSTKDKADDEGKALKIGIKTGNGQVSKNSKYVLSGEMDYEYLDQYFNPIDRFRNVDFDRDWSATTNTTLSSNVNSFSLYRTDDHIITGKASLIKDASHLLSYALSFRDKGIEVQGKQHKIDFVQKIKFIQLKADYFNLNNKTSSVASTWQRFNISPSVFLGKYLQQGYSYTYDKNEVRNIKNDTISTVMNFEQHQIFLKSPDTNKTKFSADYAYREDFRPIKNIFYVANVAKTGNINVNSQLNTNNFVGLVFTYRNLQNKISTDNAKPVENTIMGRFDWNSDILKRHIRSELTLVSSNGRELKREYIYIPVATGQGNYVWNDLNNDGVQQLNEFLEKVYNDPNGEFIRSFVPTDEYINAYSNNINYRLNLSAPRNWREKNFIKNMISKFSNVLSWTTDRKITSNGFQERFNPFYTVDKNSLLATQSNIRSTTFFNRSNPTYGIDFVFLNNYAKQLLTNGFETRKLNEYQLNMRSNFLTYFNAKLSLINNIKALTSDYLANRNYTIQSLQLKPEFAYQPKDNFRLTAGYIYNHKQNIFTTNSTENAQMHEFSAETRLSKVTSRTITGNVKLIKIKFVGDLNTAIGYEMLEALRPGDNYTWTINWQEKLTNGLQLTFSYEGRKSENVSAIHLGRMQLSALF